VHGCIWLGKALKPMLLQALNRVNENFKEIKRKYAVVIIIGSVIVMLLLMWSFSKPKKKKTSLFGGGASMKDFLSP
jgi:hypothetical protein